MYKHGEEDTILDTLRDEDITRKLFSDLNRGLLGLPNDGNIIIISDFEEEKEVHEDDRTATEVAPSSVRNSPAPSVSVVDTYDAPDGVQDDSNDGNTPNRVQNDSSDGGDKPGMP
jgi:hypothetical protein